jgi:hypothetical protein
VLARSVAIVIWARTRPQGEPLPEGDVHPIRWEQREPVSRRERREHDCEHAIQVLVKDLDSAVLEKQGSSFCALRFGQGQTRGDGFSVTLNTVQGIFEREFV